MAPLPASIEDQFPRIRADLSLLKWMVGLNLALVVSALVLIRRGVAT